MERKLTDDEALKVLDFGALRYPAEKMAVILEWPEGEIKVLMANKQSGFYQTYSRGQILGDYKLDLKLFELAHAGDLKAMELIRGGKKKRTDDV